MTPALALPRLRRRSPWWALAPSICEAAVLVVMVLAASAAAITMIAAGSSWLGLVCPLALLAGVALGYRLPWLALVLVATISLVAAVVPGVPVATWSMVCFAAFLFSLRWLSGVFVSVVLAPANFLAVAVHAGAVSVAVDPSASIFAFAVLVASSSGSALKGNVRYRIETEHRLRESERARIAAVDRGIAEERLRIARDLHDSVGHQIAVVNMHLGAAEVFLDKEPAVTRQRLSDARDAVQAVLRETQQILAVLRSTQVDQPLGAPPDHQQIGAMIDSFRKAGITVDSQIDEPPTGIPSAVGIAAHRIVQEGLTNAHRYGDGHVAITLSRENKPSEVIRIVIVNRRGTRSRPVAGGGSGLIGMRERAESVGGTLDVRQDGPLFWLSARLPI